MILKCKPTYNFQSIEFEYEINLETGEGYDDCMELYEHILQSLQNMAPEQPKGGAYVDYSYKSKIKTVTEEDLPKKEPFEPASDGQINYLVRLGVPKIEAKKMSKTEAWQMIQNMKK